MSTESTTRINDAFGKIYDRGDTGLDYMDRHTGLSDALMQHFYDDTLDTLSAAQLGELADQLEAVVDDMEFDL